MYLGKGIFMPGPLQSVCAGESQAGNPIGSALVLTNKSTKKTKEQTPQYKAGVPLMVCPHYFKTQEKKDNGI